MASHLVRQQLIIQNENSNIIPNKMMTTEKGKNSKLPLGKGESGLGSRKALGDITSKPNITKEASTRKKSPPKEEFNILEETFLHDHKKHNKQLVSECCGIEIPKNGCVRCLYIRFHRVNLTLAKVKRGPMPSDCPVSDPSKINHETISCNPELVELPVPDISDRLESAPQPDSTLHLDSPSCSVHSWKFEEVEFFLKPESED